MLNWIKKNIILNFRVGLTNLKISFIFGPLYIILQIAFYFYFKNSLAQNGFWVIFTPAFIMVVILLIYLIPKRNNPNYRIYYLFHLSKVSKIIVLIGALFLIGLYFYAQCQQYGFSIGTTCFQKIFNN